MTGTHEVVSRGVKGRSELTKDPLVDHVSDDAPLLACEGSLAKGLSHVPLPHVESLTIHHCIDSPKDVGSITLEYLIRM